MSTPEKRKTGSKPARTETISVRLDPKLRYLAELAARKQRRTLSSYVEWAVQESLRAVRLCEGERPDEDITVEQVAGALWDIDESERFVRLAIAYPDLLNHEEQERWKLVQDSGLLEPAKRRPASGSFYYDHATLEDIVYPKIRQHWHELLQAVDLGSAAMRSWALATREAVNAGKIYPKEELAAAKKSRGVKTFADMDGDIPF